MKDALSRRLRFAPPAPVEKRIVLTEGDYLMFEAIDRHGPLPTHYLYELQKAERRNYHKLQYRLTQFYNGDAGGPFLTRPPRQFNAFEARYQHVVYDLAPRAKAALASRGKLGLPKARSNDFVHDLMASCAMASIELAATQAGIRFISRHEFLKGPLSLPVGGKNLAPDDLFGLQYPDGGKRYFAFEADRGTERITTTDESQTSFGKKILSYLTILEKRLFTQWGITNLHVLTLTTMPGRAQNLRQFVQDQRHPRFTDRFGFAVEPCFGARYGTSFEEFWRMPKEPLNLFGEWQSVGGIKDITRP